MNILNSLSVSLRGSCGCYPVMVLFNKRAASFASTSLGNLLLLLLLINPSVVLHHHMELIMKMLKIMSMAGGIA